MSKQDAIANLSVRVARAEMERDAAIARAENAEADMLRAHRGMISVLNKDPEGMLDNLHIMGIPARDIKELYDREAEIREFRQKR